MTDLDPDFEDVMNARMEGKPDNWRPDGWRTTPIPTFLDRGEVYVQVKDWIARLQAARSDADLVLAIPRREQREKIPELRTARAYWRLRYILLGVDRALDHDTQFLVEEWTVNATWLVLLEEIRLMALPLKARTPYR